MPKLDSTEAHKLRGFQLIEKLADIFRRDARLIQSPVVFITEHGRYVPLDIRIFDKRDGTAETQVVLIEEPK